MNSLKTFALKTFSPPLKKWQYTAIFLFFGLKWKYTAISITSFLTFQPKKYSKPAYT
ncbi:hypothetical protein NAB1_3256 [Lactiplantibacillus plantarum]|uniref:Uncharacterized protein n=2 Tax=Lactiplantibacillus plantarum TaxID=1590 RepID=A0AAW3RK70_LACPN|nr:hypothetical protein LPLWJ_14870 [Lactiplantibacillus plantarum WJL]KPN42941.1 hypothetical protein WJL_1978 [Lactiplantibacillus plantarum WJL]KZU98214.1 hypothetical protein NAB1_3256 [Lactiplantibacillus plantarum]KZV06323.1 hypothetical protein NAB2_0191 [Lactiplantibacillus plantarum]